MQPLRCMRFPLQPAPVSAARMCPCQCHAFRPLEKQNGLHDTIMRLFVLYYSSGKYKVGVLVNTLDYRR